jgi:hypothetical protein
MQRTLPSSVPCGIDNVGTPLGPSQHCLKGGVIGVYREALGRDLSEGTSEEARPHNPKRAGTTTDEGADYPTPESKGPHP